MGKRAIWRLLSWVKNHSLYLLKKTFDPSFKFHSNLSFNKSIFKKLLPFYRQMILSWSQYLSSSPETPSQVLSQFLWYNNYIKFEDAVIHFEKFYNKNTSFSSQLFENGRIISWVNLKDKYELTNDMFYQRAQLKHAIPARWKTLILITVILTRNICVKIIMLLKELEFFLPANYPLRKYIRF